MSFTAEDAADVQFDNAPFGHRGYAKAEVDAFLARIVSTFEGRDDLTAADVHHVRFGRPLLGRRGYDEKQVDDFLDDIERELVNSGLLLRSGPRPEVREH